jgi:hypothetical protein
MTMTVAVDARSRLRCVRDFLEALDQRFPEGIALEISAAVREELEPLERAAAEHLTLEEYFQAEYADGKIDHWARASVFDGRVEIYIHPYNKSGRTTPTLIVEGNSVRPKFHAE